MLLSVAGSVCAPHPTIKRKGTPWETMLQLVFHCSIWVIPDCPQFMHSGIPCSLSWADCFAVAVTLLVWGKKKKKKKRTAQVLHITGSVFGSCFIYEDNISSWYVNIPTSCLPLMESDFACHFCPSTLWLLVHLRRAFEDWGSISLADKQQFVLCHTCNITVNYVGNDEVAHISLYFTQLWSLESREYSRALTSINMTST